MTIYTLGYSGWTMDQIKAEVARLNAVLVDVRFKPFSRFPGWNQSAFQKEFGNRYAWIKEFGNVNYKGTFKDIKILDFAAGERQTRGCNRPIILMCGCKDVNTCHRKVVAEMLAKEWDADVVHLTIPEKAFEKPRPRATLFPML